VNENKTKRPVSLTELVLLLTCHCFLSFRLSCNNLAKKYDTFLSKGSDEGNGNGNGEESSEKDRSETERSSLSLAIS
jgi:hypothetical protein